MSRAEGQRSRGVAVSSAMAIFLGAFLLFLVQPIIGKMILPWFGGTPAVWATCMLFFQVALLAGYAYAASIARVPKISRQAILHVLLLGGAVFLLPITPGSLWKPADGSNPVSQILMMLLVCVGAPYFLLSATSPLIQAWFAGFYPGRSPYRLYALSNFGSLSALLLYPFVVEPTFTLAQQGMLWSIGFVTFAAVCATLYWQLRKYRSSSTSGNDGLTTAKEVESSNDSLSASRNSINAKKKSGAKSGSKSLAKVGSDLQPAAPSWFDMSVWLLLPALASAMLLAVTNHLCQDVAVVPFLWIAPLSLYLVSLIICFDRDQWYVARWFGLVGTATILIVSNVQLIEFLYASQDKKPIWWLWDYVRNSLIAMVCIYLFLFFFVCMVCHGQVVRRRPAAEHLTIFYLVVAAGGALGGLVVAILFPVIASTLIEFKLGLVVGAFVCVRAFYVDAKRVWFPKWKVLYKTATFGLSCLIVLVVFGAQLLSMAQGGVLFQARNFYGVLTVRKWLPDDEQMKGMALYHGAIIHGFQYDSKSMKQIPTTYYGERSGVGRAIKDMRRSGSIHVGVVGLGTGTLAAYGQEGDRYRFYEINPLVIQVANDPFTFLRDCRADKQIVYGDARLSLERESPQGFDILVLDAFSGDSIPVHLLTREAFELYLNHLNQEGVIAVHVSNRYVDLGPVVAKLAESCALEHKLVVNYESNRVGFSTSDWVLMSRARKSLDGPEVREFKPISKDLSSTPVWTDQYSNLFQILRIN